MRTIEIEWQGGGSVTEIAAGLETHGRVDVLLPNNFNHALFAHFHPDVITGVESLDVRGGTEVLRRAAELDGLADLRALHDLLVRQQVQIRLLSPPRIIIGRAAMDIP